MHSAVHVDPEEERAQLSQAVVGAVAVALILLLFRDTAMSMVETWYQSNSFNHAFLIIPICIFLGWRERAALSVAEIRPAAGGLIAVLLGAVGWLLGNATGTLVIQELCLVTIIEGTLVTMYGWAVCRILAFPLLYLFLAVPVGQALVPPLQSITAVLCVGMLKWLGIPVFADGNVIAVPNGTFYVAEACSGIRYLIASLALGLLFAHLSYRSWWRKAAFLAVSIAVPILANGVRAFGIILLAYFSSNEVAVGVDHLIYGWIFFTVVTLLTLLIGVNFREGGDTEILTRVPPRRALGWSAPKVLIAGVIALSPAIGAKLYSQQFDQPPAGAVPQLRAPDVSGPWHRTDQAQDNAPPAFAAADAELHTAYEAGANAVFLHIGYYQYNRRGAQIVSSLHDLVGGNGWVLAATGTVPISIDGELVTVQSIRSTRARKGHTTWCWYWVGGRFTGSPYVAKLIETKTKLLGEDQAAAIIVLDMEYDESAKDGDSALPEVAASLRDLKRSLAAAQHR